MSTINTHDHYCAFLEGIANDYPLARWDATTLSLYFGMFPFGNLAVQKSPDCVSRYRVVRSEGRRAGTTILADGLTVQEIRTTLNRANL